jgi:hypothetical protein
MQPHQVAAYSERPAKLPTVLIALIAIMFLMLVVDTVLLFYVFELALHH